MLLNYRNKEAELQEIKSATKADIKQLERKLVNPLYSQYSRHSYLLISFNELLGYDYTSQCTEGYARLPNHWSNLGRTDDVCWVCGICQVKNSRNGFSSFPLK
jgi:hypothetical protein